jgi:hypothetical protein
LRRIEPVPDVDYCIETVAKKAKLTQILLGKASNSDTEEKLEAL